MELFYVRQLLSSIEGVAQAPPTNIRSTHGSCVFYDLQWNVLYCYIHQLLTLIEGVTQALLTIC